MKKHITANIQLLKKLTPEQAWDVFVTDANSVEKFISEFLADDRYDLDATDYKEMCQIFVKDIPVEYERPFDQKNLDYIAGLLEQHMSNYTEEKGGIFNLKLYTEEELDEMWKAETSFWVDYFTDKKKNK